MANTRKAGWMLFLFAFPLFTLYGIWRVLRWGFGLIGAVIRMRRALDRVIRCPSGHANAVVGRWECASCRAVYHGWVGRCPLCGAGAAWISCSTCGVSVRLPWERR